MLSEAKAIEILKSATGRDVSGEPRDGRGRWTAAGAQAEGAAADAMRSTGVRDYHPAADRVRGAFRALATAAQAKAQQLASSLKHVVTSTRLVSAKPIANGGIELRLRHSTGGGANVKPAVIHSTVQLHPHHVANSVTASQALGVAHRALRAAGAAPAPIRHPPITATFSRSED